MSRPFLIVGDDHEIRTAIGTDQVRGLLDQLGLRGTDRDRYEREDRETGAPLPSGVEGYHLGGRY